MAEQKKKWYNAVWTFKIDSDTRYCPDRRQKLCGSWYSLWFICPGRQQLSESRCATPPSVWHTCACKKANTQISPVSSINLFFRILTHKNNHQ